MGEHLDLPRHPRLAELTQRVGLLRLPQECESDGTSPYHRLKTAQIPTWSHFKRLFTRLRWLDKDGDTAVWVDGVAAP
ncbi:hypothetical protein [Streptomyces rimosus]|uniref:hypothetical protein n=1 Tax=Streptomyces rimosus TaxID=1927 RepID=UPI0037D49ED7